MCRAMLDPEGVHMTGRVNARNSAEKTPLHLWLRSMAMPKYAACWLALRAWT
jgi:hypothetical protein